MPKLSVENAPERPATRIRQKADVRELAAIFAGGAIGAVARVRLAQAYPAADGRWPWIVFAINVSGAFVLGYFVTRLQERLPLSTYRRPFVGTGFCGAYTTFSTMQLELLKMIDRHRYGLAAAYAGASVAAGVLAVLIATALVRRVRLLA
jgi:CrcB protein